MPTGLWASQNVLQISIAEVQKLWTCIREISIITAIMKTHTAIRSLMPPNPFNLDQKVNNSLEVCLVGILVLLYEVSTENCTFVRFQCTCRLGNARICVMQTLKRVTCLELLSALLLSCLQTDTLSTLLPVARYSECLLYSCSLSLHHCGVSCTFHEHLAKTVECQSIEIYGCKPQFPHTHHFETDSVSQEHKVILHLGYHSTPWHGPF